MNDGAGRNVMSGIYSVQHNVTAMFAHRQAMLNNGTLSKALERLSSGYRINRSSDDVAGLAVSERLRAQVRGFQRAALNIQDGASLLQTADAAIQDIHDILQRMRELLIQAANGIYSNSDRALIQQEIAELMDEIDRIHTSAEFNKVRIFDYSTADIVWIIDNSGSMGGQQASLKAAAPSFFSELANRNVDARAATIGFSNAANTSVVGNFTSNAGQFAADVGNVGTGGSGTENGMAALQFALNNLTFRQNARKFFMILTDEDSDDGGNNFTGADILASTNALMTSNEIVVDVVTSAAIIGAGANPGLPADIEYRDASTQVAGDNGIGVPNATGGRTFTSLAGTFASNLAAQVDSAIGTLFKFHVGANKNQTFTSALQAPVSTRALGLAGNVSASTQTAAENSISFIDTAIDRLTRIRSSIGAEINRLGFTLDYARVAGEAMQSAESRIRDTDMAAEIIEFTKAQVIVQSANAMLAQSNLLPQNVLSLLG